MRAKNRGAKSGLPPVGAKIESFSHGTWASLPCCRAIEGHVRARCSRLKRRNSSPGGVGVALPGCVSDSARGRDQISAGSSGSSPSPSTRRAWPPEPGPHCSQEQRASAASGCARNAATFAKRGLLNARPGSGWRSASAPGSFPTWKMAPETEGTLRRGTGAEIRLHSSLERDCGRPSALV